MDLIGRKTPNVYEKGKSLKKALIGTGVFIFLFLLSGGAYLNGLIRFNYPSPDGKETIGIDVSHHQGVINWDKVSQNNIQFVFLKATEGGDFKDTRFQVNLKQASRTSLLVGAYHFFTLCRSGRDQAKNFIHSVDRKKIHLPPVIDLEFVGNCKKRPNQLQFDKELKDYIKKIENHYQKSPIFYTTYEFFEKYLNHSAYKKYTLWLRNIFSKPDTLKGWDWTFWQYSDNSRLQGIIGPVDMNLFKGSLQELKNYGP